MNNLPDAPWIVESWYTGNDPDYHETPYDRMTDADFVEGADAEYGWRILAWVIDLDEDDCNDGEMQSVWSNLTDKAKERYCKAFRRINEDDVSEMYNAYWHEWRE